MGELRCARVCLSFVLSAARHCARSHAGHVTERPRLGFQFARSVAAEVNYSCVQIGHATLRRHPITGAVQGGNSVTHSVAGATRNWCFDSGRPAELNNLQRAACREIPTTRASCGAQAPTAERTVGSTRIIAGSLTPKPGIREQNLLIADIGRLKSRALYLSSRVAHVHARICCSARENGRHSEKEPHGRCRGEGCAQEQQQIGAPGRRGLWGLGGTIELIALVRVDQSHRIRCSVRGVDARGRRRISSPLVSWRNRPSRTRGRKQTSAPVFIIERLLIRTRRGDRTRSSFWRLLPRGVGRLLRHCRFAHLRDCGRSWRLSIALSMRPFSGAWRLLGFLLRLSQLFLRLISGQLIWRLNSFLYQRLRPDGARVAIVIAGPRVG